MFLVIKLQVIYKRIKFVKEREKKIELGEKKLKMRLEKKILSFY